jgi:glycosyltransferase involved in cell wall biosynthesis
MSAELRVSVIVPLHRDTPAFRRCLRAVRSLAGDQYELIVVSDAPVEGLPDDVRLVVTGAKTDTSPADKRDAGVAVSAGDVLAFLDDDAYPAPDWLERALARLEDPSLAAVGGPGITPPQSPFRERASGAFYESVFGSGGLRARFRPSGTARPVDDWPAYNLLIRREALARVGGWASGFYGGEDTKVCLALRDAGFTIVYDPAVLVYHHRRPIFAGHLKQVGNVGRHRGYFVRKFPGTSARPTYFLPAALLLGLLAVLPWIARRPSRRRAALVVAFGIGAVIAGSAARDGEDAAVSAVLPLVVAASHAVYGAQFLRGLATRDLAR